jgi:uncharacterized protein YjaG (DUF416 family)
MDRSDIKKRLEKLDNFTLRDVELTWVEIMLDRMKGNRRTTCEILNISMSKMRRYILNKKVFPAKLKTQGRPRNENR